MKKLLLTALVAFAGITAQAQLADGSIAPDFTATDINGVEHTLSEYLAQGKTVIIDISATWCGPCWNYHHTGALEDIYYSYGEGGSDEIVVLFIEGDPGTSVSSIYGVNTESDNSTTQGDWTKGSPYPIIDDGDGSISDAYEIAYFPTVYRICPDGLTKELTQPTRAQIKSSVNSGCGTLEGITNNVVATTSDVRVCDASGVAKATVKNYGTNSIPVATVSLKQGNTVLATQATSGSMAAFASKTVTFDEVTFDPSQEYTVEVTDVNGSAPSIPANAVAGFDVLTPLTGYNNVTINVYTDNYPSEISWKIFNSGNEVVAEGGPYQPGTADQWNGGGPDANTVKSSYVVLPGTSTECYKVELYDAFNDGWSLGNTPHGIEIIDNSGATVFEQMVGNFGSTLSTPAAFKTNGTLDNEVVEARTFKMYPNPTTGIITFSTVETVTVSIVDVAGKVVFNANNINNGDSINLGSLQKGIYIAQIKGEITQKTEKIVIN